jgi:isopenicillin-N epimerase
MKFMLEPDVVFLNHGSFGACPVAVFDEYQRLQARLESQPVRFLQRELPDLLAAARASLADFVGADAHEVVYVPNPTFAANTIARSLNLTPDDEVLISDHEYGACQFALQFMSEKLGFKIVKQTISLPVESNASIVDQFWGGVTNKTQLIFISQITSPTALTIPVAEICRRARERNILSMVDGAHAPGQIPVDLDELGADFYTATCHKWMCGPKGTALFFARADKQHLIEPLIVGWGWGKDKIFDLGHDFLDIHEWLGTHDPAGYLTIPFAIRYLRDNGVLEIQKRAQELARMAVSRCDQTSHASRVHADEFFQQMGLVEIPADTDTEFKQRLYDHHKVEVPITNWNQRKFVRISAHAYTTESHIESLVTAMQQELG